MIVLKEWLETAALLAGGAFALFQYAKANRWKRSEFAAQQLDLLRTDPELNLAARLIDWSGLEVEVPERYRAAFGKDTFTHSVARTVAAMMPEAKKQVFPWPEPLYRHVFDALFQYLDRIGHYLDIGLLEVKDVEPLRYYLEQICSWRHGNRDEHHVVFAEYIHAYQFPGIIGLAGAFGLAFPSPLRDEVRHTVALEAQRTSQGQGEAAA